MIKLNGSDIATKFSLIVGSWRFIIIQSIALVIFLIYNILPGHAHFDPYPFILLNLCLSFQAAYTGPIILMAQNAMAEKDREVIHKDLFLSESTESELRALIAIVHEHNHDVDTILDVIQSKFPTKRG